MKDWLSRYTHLLPTEEILSLRQSLESELLVNPRWDEAKALMDSLVFEEEVRFELSDEVQIRGSNAWETEHQELLSKIIKALLPWRKGPFNFMGVPIDAEWQSFLKWNRMISSLPELRGRRIVDIGCNNGYYMMQLLKYAPECVIGFDPSSRCYYQFELFQKALQDSRLAYEVFGVQDLGLFKDFFDVSLCLGVIYHRRDPYTSCKLLFDSLRSSGVLFLESLVIPGEDAVALCPEGRYAKMRNVWYVPTVSCMKVWLAKAGFKDIEVVSVDTVTLNEQRQTELAPYESLAHFLDPLDQTKTIEGYLAPTRAILKARKE